MSNAPISAPVAALIWQLAALKTPQPVPEHRFHPSRKWRFDLAWVDKKVAAEVDGGSWVGGRHTSGSGFEKDLEKMNAAVELGWKVLRFTPRMIDDGTALATLERVLA